MSTATNGASQEHMTTNEIGIRSRQQQTATGITGDKHQYERQQTGGNTKERTADSIKQQLKRASSIRQQQTVMIRNEWVANSGSKR